MNTLKAQKRELNVKAKKLRREGFVTGSVFGRNIETFSIKMALKDVNQLLKTDQKGSQIILDVDGECYNVLIKEVQYNTMQKRVDEMDFQVLVSDVKVHSTAEIVFVNHDKIIEGVLQEDLTEIPYVAYPSALVSKIRLDVGGMKVGDVIKVKDLDIAKNSEIDLRIDPETIVASVFASHNKAADEEEETAEEKE